MSREPNKIDDLAERVAKAYLAGDEAGARAIRDATPMKTFEYAVFIDRLRKLVGK